MNPAVNGRIVVSRSAATRRARAMQFVSSLPAGTEVLLISTNRAAADDLARDFARERPATFGLHRFSLPQLAARLAATRLAAAGLSPSTQLGTEAVAARAAFDTAHGDGLQYFGAVAAMPGFAPALARTLHELRMAAVEPHALGDVAAGGSDLARLHAATQNQFAAGRSVDRPALLAAACDALQSGHGFCRGCAIALLDVSVDSLVERRFVQALLDVAREWFAAVPGDDRAAVAALAAMGGGVVDDEDTEATGDVPRLRHYLFQSEAPPPASPSGDVIFFSAPGEGREAVEVVRYVLDEARRGIRFDDMAVLLRSPREYVGLLEHAFARVGVPAWFDRGTRRPHPAGRALLALLACAGEDLSARRFAEYLSLAQVPEAAVEAPEVVRPADDMLATGAERIAAGEIEPAEPDAVTASDADPDAPVVSGSLRTPWRWEELLVESAVIGGRDRWRRLDGLAREYRLRLRDVRREDPTSPRVGALERDLRNLEHLRAFARPLIRELSRWPPAATWGQWIDRLEALVPRVIRTPGHVSRVLAELRPMAAVGPVTLRELRDVLGERLRTLSVEPPPARYGRVFVGTPDQARGRQFRVAFVPGLAERLFPQKLREDPLLPDDSRQRLDPSLATRDRRVRRERLLLQLCVGAATDRVYVSYPRVELREARPRVPSFYALDVIRATTGTVPGIDDLQADAARATATSLAWPAPPDPSRAIDEFEHDLAVLHPLLHLADQQAVRGRARYLLDLNPHLRRSLSERWRRWKGPWTSADGIVSVTPAIGPALASQRLTARPYSLSALQRFSACPYQFLLGAVYRLEPLEEPTPLQRMDPLTRGALFHAIQAAFFRERSAHGSLPVTPATLADALAALDQVVDAVTAQERDALAPAVERVWRDEVAALRKDLRRWVVLQAERDPAWTPERFELAFGLPSEGRDEHSIPDPAVIEGRFLLRGAIDLVERHQSRALRVTDHKTGRKRATITTTIDGGATLQPVLYSLALESATGEHVEAGRLYYCTHAGGFAEHVVTLDPVARRTGIEALEIIDRAVERGFLAASPRQGACAWCDFRPVCGPLEETRATKKDQKALGDLLALRELP